MNLAEITPFILTYNEKLNIGRALDRLAWASQILIVDSFSDDGTLEIAAQYPQVRLIQRKFDSFAEQCNFGMEQIQSPWILVLDADYILSESYQHELTALQPPEIIDAFYARFRYVVFNRALRGSLYPPRAVLFRKARCNFYNDGHTQRLKVDGPTSTLSTFILHDDRKPLSRWLTSQDSYSRKEAVKLMQTRREELRFQDRLRLLIIPAPLLVFFYCLIVRGLILDGFPGWFYVWQRVLAEVMLSLRLLEKKLGIPHD